LNERNGSKKPLIIFYILQITGTALAKYPETTSMKKGKLVWAAATAVLTGVIVYLIARKRKISKRKKTEEKEEHMANVFSHSKRYGGSEFVL
jgi:hypothetical protein